MYNLVLQIIVFTSLGSVIYMMVSALPRVSDVVAPPRGPGFFDRLMSKLPMAKIDERINAFFAKFLRRLKVVVMKIDNFINHRLGRLAKKGGGDSADKTGDNTQKLL